MNLRVVRSQPPNLEQIRAAGLRPGPRTVFTYGDCLHNPGGGPITVDLLMHEETHQRQQSEFDGGPEAWWKRYCSDPHFRFNQEVEAYRNQYHSMNRSQRRSDIARLARDLSGPLYGRLVDFETAKEIIEGV